METPDTIKATQFNAFSKISHEFLLTSSRDVFRERCRSTTHCNDIATSVYGVKIYTQKSQHADRPRVLKLMPNEQKVETEGRKLK